MADLEDILGSLDEQEQQKQAEAQRAEQIGAVENSGVQIKEALSGHTNELTSSIHDLLMATLVSKDPKIAETAKNLAGLLGEIKKASDGIKGANFKPLSDNLAQLQQTLTDIPGQIEAANKSSDPNPKLEEIAKTLGEKNFNPNITVKAPSVDLSSLNKLLGEIKQSLSQEKTEKTDTIKLEKLTADVSTAVKGVKAAVQALRFPVPNYVLPFKTDTGKDTQVKLSAAGGIPVVNPDGSTISGGGGGGSGVIVDGVDSNIKATVADLTNSNPLAVEIVDGNGTQITSFGGGTQYADGAARGTATGTISMVDDGTNVQSVKGDTDGTPNSNTTKLGGTAIDTNSGAKSGGTQRVVLATDQPQLTNAWKVDGSAVTQPVSGTVAIGSTITPGTGATNLGKAEDSAHTTGDVGVAILGVRRDADTSPVDADGDYHNFIFNAIGRLKVSVLPAATVATTGNITASGQSVTIDVSRQAAVNIQVAGTFSNFNGIFEASIDSGSTYATVQAVRSSTGVIESTTGVISANPGYLWEISANGYTNIRIRATALTSGTVNVTMLPAAMAAENAPSVALQPSSNIIGSLAANQSVNTAQVNGQTVNVGTGAAGTGTQRVTTSIDSTIGTVTTVSTVSALGTGTTGPMKAEDVGHTTGDMGIPAWGVRNDNAATTPTNANADYSQISVDGTGSVFTRVTPSNTGTLANVASSATSVTILAANAARRNFIIYNDSTQDMYIKYGTTASSTSFTYYLPSLGTLQDEFYAGRIDGIWASANGNARVTEVTV